MKHAVMIAFIVTMSAGFVALTNAAIIWKKTGDSVVRYFLMLFLGLSGQIIATVAINYYLITGGEPGTQIFSALLALVNFSIAAMGCAVIVSINELCAESGKTPEPRSRIADVAAIIVSSVIFFLGFFACTVEPESLMLRLNGLRYILLYLPATIIYAMVRGIAFVAVSGKSRATACLRVMIVMGGMFLPFFALSFLRVIIAGEMRIGFDMYSMLPFSAFYFLVSAAFMIFVNRTYFVLFSETERKDDMPDDAFYRNHGITAREREVMERALAGSDNKTIARELGISVNTVKVHASSIFRKLGVRNRFELVKFARNPRSSTERLGD